MKKILVVEDDKFLLQVYKTKLQARGHEVYTLESGEGVMEAVKTNSVDAVLLDIILPKKDGIKILKELKRDEQTKNIPVVMLSVLSSGDMLTQIKELGPDAVKSKMEATFDNVLDSLKTVWGSK